MVSEEWGNTSTFKDRGNNATGKGAVNLRGQIRKE